MKGGIIPGVYKELVKQRISPRTAWKGLRGAEEALEEAIGGGHPRRRGECEQRHADTDVSGAGGTRKHPMCGDR